MYRSKGTEIMNCDEPTVLEQPPELVATKVGLFQLDSEDGIASWIDALPGLGGYMYGNRIKSGRYCTPIQMSRFTIEDALSMGINYGHALQIIAEAQHQFEPALETSLGDSSILNLEMLETSLGDSSILNLEMPVPETRIPRITDIIETEHIATSDPQFAGAEAGEIVEEARMDVRALTSPSPEGMYADVVKSVKARRRKSLGLPSKECGIEAKTLYQVGIEEEKVNVELKESLKKGGVDTISLRRGHTTEKTDSIEDRFAYDLSAVSGYASARHDSMRGQDRASSHSWTHQDRASSHSGTPQESGKDEVKIKINIKEETQESGRDTEAHAENPTLIITLIVTLIVTLITLIRDN